MLKTETHPFEPFVPADAKLLMCGTFPPGTGRWSMKFYYPNFINDMWRIFGIIYFGDKDYLVDVEHKTFHLELIKEMLEAKGIALSDTGVEAIRHKGNASDKFLEIVRPIDLGALLARMPHCRAIATTGEKAASVIASLTDSEVPKTGEYVDVTYAGGDGVTRNLRHWRMPSSSRAYPMKIELKADAYRRMLRDTGLL